MEVILIYSRVLFEFFSRLCLLTTCLRSALIWKQNSRLSPLRIPDIFRDFPFCSTSTYRPAPSFSEVPELFIPRLAGFARVSSSA